MDPTDTNQQPDPPVGPSGIAPQPRLEFTPPPAALAPAYGSLGARGLALAIDALVWLVVVIPLALLEGGFQASNGLFRLQITGLPAVVAMLAWVTYMTVMEWKVGASVGKLVTRLRVVTEDGSPVGPEASAIRNVLRVVDAFPYLFPYLVGAVAAARSPMRQRFGDRFAETIVVSRVPRQAAGPTPVSQAAVPAPVWQPAVPAPVARVAARRAPAGRAPAEAPPSPSGRRRGRRPLIVLAVGLALVVAGAYAFVAIRGHCDVGGGTYDCHGVRFTYPSSWSVIKDVRIVSSGNLEFGDVVGLDPLNNVELQGYRLSQPVDAGNMDRFEREMSMAADQLAATISGKVTDGPTRVQIGGLPGFRVRIEGSVGGKPLTLTRAALVRGTTEYFLECRSTPDHARNIRSGCRQVMRTFRAA